jgi:undecaprenyl-diphosphatase
MTGIEALVLGVAQGITEWIPISSEGVLVLLMTRLFGHGGALYELVQQAVFLHLGTVCAAVVYYRHTLLDMVKALKGGGDVRTLVQMRFLVIATIVTGIVGVGLLLAMGSLIDSFSGGFLMVLIGILLLMTGGVQFLAKKKDTGSVKDQVTTMDALVAGIAQGCAILPGLSRSGLTISALLLRRVQDDYALSLSFLMSIPAIIGANIILGSPALVLSWASLIAFFSSFVVGFSTIHLLLGVARRVSFRWFVIGFGLLAIIAGLMSYV